MRFLFVYILFVFIPFSKGHDHFHFPSPQQEIFSLQNQGYTFTNKNFFEPDEDVPDFYSGIENVNDDDSDFSSNKKKNLLSGHAAALLQKQRSLTYQEDRNFKFLPLPEVPGIFSRLYIYHRVLRI
jgi:hypothetical protein